MNEHPAIIKLKTVCTTNIYDLSTLKRVSRNNPELFNKGLTILIKMLSSEKQNILTLIETNNWEEISMIVHKIKSSLIHINVTSLNKFIIELERYELHSDSELRTSSYMLCSSLEEILQDLNKELLPC